MFEKVSLKSVKQVISFAGKESSFKGDNNIPELQTQGVTALCKILNNRQYAYLADEVGMGKTYQAIGVISMLLKEKPNAKILIIAPNRSVQNNWISEIKNFQKNNLIENLELNVKNYTERLDFLKSFKEKNKENIFLTRLTTFSTIRDSIIHSDNPKFPYYEKVSVKTIYKGLRCITDSIKETNYACEFDSFDAGKICGKFLRNYTPSYDLVIIDEAQNIRNENNATAFLNYWLGLKRSFRRHSPNLDKNLSSIAIKKKYGSKFLLLSATPAHRNIECLRNQLLYFENEYDVPKSIDFTHDYLSKFLIRRLRTYNNDTKYSVRNITANDVTQLLETDSKEGLEQRLFLALIQSKLAQENAKNNSSYKIGFLETFESYKPSNPIPEDEETGEKEKEFENSGSQEDGEKGAAPDKTMLQQISKSFYDNFGDGKYPPHPKFSFMEKELEELLKKNFPGECLEEKALEKAVVFVRRLATVDELETRLNSMYEDRIVSYWGKVFNIQKATLKDIQAEFESRYNNTTERQSNSEDIEDNEEETDSENSDIKLLKWLALKKQHKGKDYFAVSKFKKSLLRNKPNSYLFSENYFKTLYSNEDINLVVDDSFVKEVNEYMAGERNRYILEYNDNKKYNLSEILPLCCYLALNRKVDNKYAISLASFIKNFYAIKEKVENHDCGYKKASIIKILQQDSLWNHMANYGVDISNQDLYKREILKAIAEKYIKSSEAILELMYCYITESSDNLCPLVMKRLFSKHCSSGIRIKKLFDTGDLICKQLLGGEIIGYESQIRQKLGFLDLQQWVMPATGGNKGNEGLIKRFNTPFYPDVIVCTDVLKEGINLHLFCNRIYHYGLAWTPGDLEQRIGRIDRFFSKTHRERALQENLSDEDKTKIEVNYPYMGKSVDEHQLKQVLKFKLSADPLLDSKKLDQKDIQIDLEEKSVDELATYKPADTDVCPYSGEKYWGT